MGLLAENRPLQELDRSQEKKNRKHDCHETDANFERAQIQMSDFIEKEHTASEKNEREQEVDVDDDINVRIINQIPLFHFCVGSLRFNPNVYAHCECVDVIQSVDNEKDRFDCRGRGAEKCRENNFRPGGESDQNKSKRNISHQFETTRR